MTEQKKIMLKPREYRINLTDPIKDLVFRLEIILLFVDRKGVLEITQS